MKKKIVIANCIYLPIDNGTLQGGNKYVAGSISGDIFLNEIYTLEEIKEKHKNSDCTLHECKDLRDLCAKWATK